MNKSTHLSNKSVSDTIHQTTNTFFHTHLVLTQKNKTNQPQHKHQTLLPRVLQLHSLRNPSTTTTTTNNKQQQEHEIPTFLHRSSCRCLINDRVRAVQNSLRQTSHTSASYQFDTRRYRTSGTTNILYYYILAHLFMSNSFRAHIFICFVLFCFVLIA